MQTVEIPIHKLSLNHKIEVARGKYEQPERITPSRKNTYVTVRTKNHTLVYDGYVGKVKVAL